MRLITSYGSQKEFNDKVHSLFCQHLNTSRCFFLIRLHEDDEGAAEIDALESYPSVYDHPTNPYIKFWDLPGIGTPDYPDLETYYQKVELEKYDAFLIFTADRFTENDLALARKISISFNKKFFFIRTKIDIDVTNEMRKQSFNEDAVLEKIRRHCLENLGDLLRDDQSVFLISNHHLEKWDFTLLTQDILNALTTFQRESLILSLTRSSRDLIQRKVEVLKGRIWMVASASAAAALVPIPGLSIAVDAVLILKELSFYRSQLGLPETGSDKFAALPFSTQEKVSKVSLTTIPQLVAYLAASYTADAAVEDKIRYIPFVSLAIASGMSFTTTYFALKKLLKHVEEVAELVLREAAQKAINKID